MRNRYIILLCFAFMFTNCSVLQIRVNTSGLRDSEPFALTVTYPDIESENQSDLVNYSIRNTLFEKIKLRDGSILVSAEFKLLTSEQLDSLKMLRDKIVADNEQLLSYDINCTSQTFAIFDNNKCIYCTFPSFAHYSEMEEVDITFPTRPKWNIRNENVNELRSYLESIDNSQCNNINVPDIRRRPAKRASQNGNHELQIITSLYQMPPLQHQIILTGDSLKSAWASRNERLERDEIRIRIPQQTASRIFKLLDNMDSQIIEGHERPLRIGELTVYYDGKLLYHGYQFRKSTAPNEIQALLNIVEGINPWELQGRLGSIWDDQLPDWSN